MKQISVIAYVDLYYCIAFLYYSICELLAIHCVKIILFSLVLCKVTLHYCFCMKIDTNWNNL